MRYPRPHIRSTTHRCRPHSPRCRCTVYSPRRRHCRGIGTGREHIQRATWDVHVALSLLWHVLPLVLLLLSYAGPLHALLKYWQVFGQPKCVCAGPTKTMTTTSKRDMKMYISMDTREKTNDMKLGVIMCICNAMQ